MAGKKELSAEVGYAGNDLDRQSDRRDDADYVAALMKDSEARTFVIAGDNVVLERDSDGHRSLYTFAEAALMGAPRETVFLGHDGVGGVFATLLSDGPQDLGPDPEQLSRAYRGAPGQGFGQQRIDLRTIATQGLVSGKQAGRLAEAKSLLYWHSRHRFCSNCGAPTRIEAAGWKRVCDGCKGEHFPRTDPVVIMLAVSGDKCLLGRQPRFPKGMYSALAGFVVVTKRLLEVAPDDAARSRRDLGPRFGEALRPVAGLDGHAADVVAGRRDQHVVRLEVAQGIGKRGGLVLAGSGLTVEGHAASLRSRSSSHAIFVRTIASPIARSDKSGMRAIVASNSARACSTSLGVMGLSASSRSAR